MGRSTSHSLMLFTTLYLVQRSDAGGGSPDDVMRFFNGTRVLDDLTALRKIGGTGGGRFGFGVSRRALTAEDIEARRWVAARAQEAGLRDVSLDGIGTVLGVGGRVGAPLLLMGSHSDTQPEGGWLDGALGIVLALEAARALSASAIAELAPMGWAFVNFQDEEGRLGTLTGSRAFAGVGPSAAIQAKVAELSSQLENPGRYRRASGGMRLWP